MGDEPSREMWRPGAGALLAIAVAAGCGLLAIYWLGAGALQGRADVRAFSSGIFDMDAARVVVDFTSARPAYRASVHPLQKLLIAPLGGALNTALFAGSDPVAAARLLIAAFMTLQTLAAGALAWQLVGRSLSAAVSAACLCAFSFSSWLAASIPESAAVASLTTVLPLLFLNIRWQRRFGAWEALGWAFLALLAVGLTVTQLVHCLIALGVRARWGREQPGPGSASLLPKLLLAGVLLAVLFAGALRLQSSLYPDPPRAETGSPLANELNFMRTERLAAAPVAHVVGLLSHFFVIDFVAPHPGISDFLIRDYGLDYWSLSLEEAGPEAWAPTQRVVAALLLAAALAALAGLRRADARYLAPALCVGSQLAMHLFYGREYVLYSPHWHGVLVALGVALLWRGFPGRRPALTAAAAGLSLALLANDVAVMRGVYGELEAGLEIGARDTRGALLEDRRRKGS